MKIPLSWPRLAVILVLGLLGTGVGRAQATTLYGVTYFDNQLIQVDTTTGAGTLVAPLSVPISPYGIAFRGNQLYTFDSDSDRIRQINPSTGVVSPGIDIGVGNLTGEGDLAFRPDGIGFLSSALTPDFQVSNDLFRFDLTLGTSVRIGSTSVVLDGMVFVGNTLYAVGQEADATLYIVNQNTAALTPVGSLGVTMNSPFGALTVDANGALFGAINDQLYSINRSTGAATALDPTVLDIGFSSVSGLAPAPQITPVPEPSTYGLASVALLLGAAAARRRRQRLKLKTEAA